MAAPICLPYLMVFCGLSDLPGKLRLKYDLSYGIYLIHAPVLFALSLMFTDLRNWWTAAVAVLLITSSLAYASWVFVEMPALGRKKAAAAWVHRCIRRIAHPLGMRSAARASVEEKPVNP